MNKEITEIRDKFVNGELEANEAFWAVIDILSDGKFYTDQEIKMIEYKAFCEGTVDSDTGCDDLDVDLINK